VCGYVDACSPEELLGSVGVIGGLDRYSVSVDNAVGLVGAPWSIYTVGGLSVDPSFTPNVSWWERRLRWLSNASPWLQVTIAGLGLAVFVGVAIATKGAAIPFMLNAAKKAAVSGFVLGGAVGGLMTARTGGCIGTGILEGAVRGAIMGAAMSVVMFGLVSGVVAVKAKVGAGNVASVGSGVGNSDVGAVSESVQVRTPTDGLGDLDWNWKADRVNQVMKHATPNPNKPIHTVFSGDPIAITNKAWSIRGGIAPINDGLSVYIIPFKNAGTLGESAVRIVVMPGTSKLVSAYPWLIPPM